MFRSSAAACRLARSVSLPLAGTGEALQPILIRGLSHTYDIDAAWSETPLAFTRTTPDLFAPVPVVEPIAVEGTGPPYKLRLPSGRWLEGSLRWLAFQLDQFLMLQAIVAAAESLVLRAALLRDPRGVRVAFAGGKGTGKSWLSIALLATGWHFEGDAYAVVRREGIVALPRTLRLRTPLRALPPSWREPLGLAPCLRCDGGKKSARWIRESSEMTGLSVRVRSTPFCFLSSIVAGVAACGPSTWMAPFATRSTCAMAE